MKRLLLFIVLIGFVSIINAQIGTQFLGINTDGKSAALGNSGVATAPDMYAIYNPGKLSQLIEQEYGLGLSYASWQPSEGIKGGLFNLTGYKRINDESYLGLDVRFMNYGKIPFYDENGYKIYDYSPNDYTIGLTYSRQLSENISMGISGRYIRSSPALGVEYAGHEVRSANALGLDAGLYYNSPSLQEDETYGGFRFGIAVKNLGSALKYMDNSKAIKQPLAAVAGASYLLPSYNENKVMATVEGGFLSGSGYTAGGGLEFSYKSILYVRGGYRMQNPDKSTYQMFTGGLGFRFNTFGIDLSYQNAIKTAKEDVPKNIFNNSFAATLLFELEKQ